MTNISLTKTLSDSDFYTAAKKIANRVRGTTSNGKTCPYPVTKELLKLHFNNDSVEKLSETTVDDLDKYVYELNEHVRTISRENMTKSRAKNTPRE